MSTRPNNNDDDFTVLTNVAYGEVKIEPTLKEEVYAEPDKVIGSVQGHSEKHPATTGSPPTSPVYDN